MVYFYRLYFGLITDAFNQRHFREAFLESYTIVLEWTK